MVRLFAVAGVGLAGCSLFLGDGVPDELAGADSGVDAPVDGPSDNLYQAWHRQVDPTLLSGTWFPGVGCTIDTDQMALTSCGTVKTSVESGRLVLSAESVTFTDRIEIIGGAPVVVVARSLSLSRIGVIAASGARINPMQGPPHCTGGLGAVVSNGAGGGGLGAPGAPGGGDTVSGAKVELDQLDGVAVGCPGGEGGGQRATGGGGVHLIATDSLSISGRIYAHGGSGAAGQINGGAGGGGSGGMIVLDSRAIEIGEDAELGCNGGSGGGGGGSSMEGEPGKTESTVACTTPGGSTEGSGPGGAGGCQMPDGPFPAMPGELGQDSPGSGGGGGGVGYILLHGDADPTVETIAITPLPTEL